MLKHDTVWMLNWKRKLLCFLFYVLELFSVRSHVIHRIYDKWIGDIFVDEFHMAQVTAQDRVIHIGCGSLPTMSILAAKEAKATVVAIDTDEKAVQRAKQYIAKQGFSHYIHVELGDGASYPLGSFDVIFIATNVTPVDAVFCNLASSMKPEVRIICRDLGFGVLHLLGNQEFASFFSIKATQVHQRSSSLLIIKKP
jgi:2-polyprenyl-3-methyl-5-hydroxy-6-metoxy-1,4-benzoquinol methylase